MNRLLKQTMIVKAMGKGIIELLFYLPIFLIPAVYLFADSSLWIWIATLPLCYGIGAFLAGKFTNMRYVVRLLLAAAVGGVQSSLLLFPPASSVGIAAMAAGLILTAVITMRGMSGYIKGWSTSFTNTHLLIGILIYVLMQPLKLMVFKQLIPYNGLLIICGIACVILFFFFANERHMNSETADVGKSSATFAFKRQNRIMMLIIVGLIGFIALFRQIGQAVERFFHDIIDRFMDWMNRPKEEQIPAEELPEAAPPQMPVEAAKPPSDWMLLIEQIFKIIGIVIAVIAICILLYFIIKKVMQWISVIVAKLQERGADNRDQSEGYTDEVESLVSIHHWREQMGNQFRKRFMKKRTFAEEWEGLATNSEKIRFLYAHYIREGEKQGYVAKPHLTPRETVDDLVNWQAGKPNTEGIQQMVDVYEEVRYGDKFADDEQVRRLKQPFVKDSKG
ncbi:DUF4129 domain-containing protein [Paenibacillus sinopodophylli]|uniref:DUF4129 domain-containing protein n=1 Tax=Paenibacillus sinopodophylli TaxID=1837342 RepID=UPI00110CE599|nr:DUF4129 domain-containing protein [Paenibacillus sinopodophylli]